MIPGHALRIQTMLRSMLEEIVPAIDPGAQLARDQAQILVANLRLLADQADRTYEYEMAELREYAALLQALVAAASGGEATAVARAEALAALQAIAPLAALPIPSYAELSRHVRRAKAAADGLVEAANVDGAPASRVATSAAVLAQAAAQNRRERVWFKAAGLDAAPATLPTLDEVLQVAPAASGSGPSAGAAGRRTP